MSVQFQDNTPPKQLSEFENFQLFNEFEFNIEAIIDSYKILLDRVPLNEDTGQICLTYTKIVQKIILL